MLPLTRSWLPESVGYDAKGLFERCPAGEPGGAEGSHAFDAGHVVRDECRGAGEKCDSAGNDITGK